MEPESSLPHSYHPATWPYPETARSRPYPPPPQSTTWKSVLILPSHLRLGLLRGILCSGFLFESLYTPLLSPIRATCPTHHILLDLINRIIMSEKYKSLSSSLCRLLHSPDTSFHLGTNILLSTLFSNILNLRYSLKVSDQVSHPYTTTSDYFLNQN